MTREELIQILEELREPYSYNATGHHHDVYRALSIVINAMKMRPTKLLSDGTLIVHDGEEYPDVKQILLQHGTSGKLYYPEEGDKK